MADPVEPDDGETDVLAELTPAERAELDARRYLKRGDELVWIEPGTGVRREKLSRLYYVRTDRGVFRVSRITGEVVEV